MSKFKLLKDFNGQKVGEEVTVHDSIDNDMIRYGYGEKANEAIIRDNVIRNNKGEDIIVTTVEESAAFKAIESDPENKAITKAPKNKAK